MLTLGLGYMSMPIFLNMRVCVCVNQEWVLNCQTLFFIMEIL